MRLAAATLGLGIVSIVLSAAPAHAAPTITDFATCNAEAEDRTATGAPSALPREAGAGARLDASAESAAAAPATREGTDQSGTIVTSPANPQFEGMAAARANDSAYRAAYQSCMRRRGF
jgi:hypothetical protein